MGKIEQERRFRRERATAGKGLRCEKKKRPCTRRRMFIISVRSFLKEKESYASKRALSYDYRRATRNPFSCFLQAAQAFTLAVTRNRLQIPVFLCILAGHYSANNCRCEWKRLHCRRRVPRSSLPLVAARNAKLHAL